ncbi:MAG: prepilin-type N-terminal cleavage/methylation domain-containing protein [Terriglobales bacterium]|jgi:general secretion pathway protein G
MSRRRTSRDTPRRTQGFTLVELMVAISIILILLGVAMPIYSHSIMRAREDNLRKNLETLNYMIYQYAQDKQKAPQSLDELKTAGYLKSIPNDITGNPDTWETEPGEDVIMSLDQTEPGGIVGVHSGSNQVGSDGKAYSEW